MKKIAYLIIMSLVALNVSAVGAQNTTPDTTPPVITLVGPSTEEYLQGELYEERGATANDNVDGDVSSYLEITGDVHDASFAGTYAYAGYISAQGTDGKWYKINGPAGGFATDADYYLVPVAFKTNLPFNFGRLEINGTTEYWFKYRLDGNHIQGIVFKKTVGGRLLGTFASTFTVSDSSFINSSITIHSGIVDTTVPGTYLVRYNVKDRSGNNAQEVIRKVIVHDTGLSREQAYALLKGEDPNNPLIMQEPPMVTEGEQESPEGTTNKTITGSAIEYEKRLFTQTDDALISRLAGHILLQVDEHGEAWYIDPVSRNKYYLEDGGTAYEALRKFGLGITNADLAEIPVGIESRFKQFVDSDGDGLADTLEEALGTDGHIADTDSDGTSDGIEVMTNRTNPLGEGPLSFNTALANRLRGKILLQVESKGEAWYVNPDDGMRYYMNNGDAAYQIMRFLSLGIANVDLRKIPVGNF